MPIGATDGSGGEQSSDPRLRRCGWGAVVSTLESEGMTVLAHASGGIEGKQTVPRAELTALAWIAWRTSGDITVAVDAMYVVKGFNRGEQWVHGSNVGLWQHLWQGIAERQGAITLRWTKSHPTVADLELYEDVPVWQFRLNAWVDGLAEAAAAEAGFGQRARSRVSMIDGMAHKVLCRLSAVAEAWKSFTEEIREFLVGAGAEFAEAPARESQLSKAETIKVSLLDTGHSVQVLGQVMRCSRCMTGISKARSTEDIVSWLETPCRRVADHGHVPESKGLALHPSHTPARYRGVTYCVRCGGWMIKKGQKLGTTCRPPTTTGLQFLRDVARGKLPSNLKEWPDQRPAVGRLRTLEVLPKAGDKPSQCGSKKKSTSSSSNTSSSSSSTSSSSRSSSNSSRSSSSSTPCFLRARETDPSP